MKLSAFLFFCLFSFCCPAQKTVGPLPSAKQLEWQDKPFYLFMHFGPNTFTDLEWGKGTENEEVFNPAALDCSQWCRIAKAAGARGIVITAKHHDGFCLCPSAYSKHTVAQSKWRNGKGDVLKELYAACHESGLSMGVYLSPWDRNHPAYGTPAYNEVFMHMMREVVKNYGPFFEFWWDGANGEGPNGKKMVYDWVGFKSTLQEIAPNTVVFSDIGPDIRWVGNEDGEAGSTNWNLLDTVGFTPGSAGPSADTLNHGNENGKAWIPAECDVSIRPGWFYHQAEDSLVKTPERLFNLYLKSVGRGANLILNVPPNRMGLISSYDSAALMGFAQLRAESFQQPLNNQWTDRDGMIEIIFAKKKAVNCLMLKESIAYGQRVKSFSIELVECNQTVYKNNYTTIGHERILTFPKKEVTAIRVRITDSKGKPMLKEIKAYEIGEQLVENK